MKEDLVKFIDRHGNIKYDNSDNVDNWEMEEDDEIRTENGYIKNEEGDWVLKDNSPVLVKEHERVIKSTIVKEHYRRKNRSHY